MRCWSRGICSVETLTSDSVVPASSEDLLRLEAFLSPFFQRGELLFIPREKLKKNIRRFLLARQPSGAILGSLGLFEWGKDLVEVRAFAVDAKVRGMGIGSMLLESALSRARLDGKQKVFALTYKIAFFTARGFCEVPKESLPHKIWGDCVLCLNRENCKEKSVIFSLKAQED